MSDTRAVTKTNPRPRAARLRKARRSARGRREVDVDLLAVLEDERDRIRDDREQNDEPCEDAPLGGRGFDLRLVGLEGLLVGAAQEPHRGSLGCAHGAR
jgi:hypothetical protein